VKDSNGNVVVPRWILGAIVALGGTGAGTGAVTVYKVDALAERLTGHESKAHHDSAMTGPLYADLIKRIADLSGEVTQGRIEQTRQAQAIARIETILDEMRRPR
jgi:hypothetical protein